MTSEVLNLHEVNFRRDSQEILKNIILTVQAGEHWALLGSNGAGKSTLLSLCGAVKHPTSGTVTVLGKQLGRVDIRELRQSIGHVNPRHPLRSPLKMRDVVLTGATGTVERMMRWHPTPAQARRADELIALLGLGKLEHATWDTMSQGERGRTLIARALLPDPPLLLLDEPSTGLDVAAREQLLTTIDDLHRSHPRLATVLVTHHFEEIPQSTSHAALLKDGALVDAGPVLDVLTTQNVSECFTYPIAIECRNGRWSAQALTSHSMTTS